MNEFYEIEQVGNEWVVTPLQGHKYWISNQIKCGTESDATRVLLLLSSQDLIVKGVRDALKKVAMENAQKFSGM
jgi:hypothetical protein